MITKCHLKAVTLTIKKERKLRHPQEELRLGSSNFHPSLKRPTTDRSFSYSSLYMWKSIYKWMMTSCCDYVYSSTLSWKHRLSLGNTSVASPFIMSSPLQTRKSDSFRYVFSTQISVDRNQRWLPVTKLYLRQWFTLSLLIFGISML